MTEYGKSYIQRAHEGDLKFQNRFCLLDCFWKLRKQKHFPNLLINNEMKIAYLGC